MSQQLAAGERALLAALRGLRFGSVEAIVHDGRIQRIERREKVRIEDDPTAESPDATTHDTTRKRPDGRSFSRNETERRR